MTSTSTELIVRDTNTPTTQQLEERRQREQEDREWNTQRKRQQDGMERQLWWAKLAAVAFVAMCVIAGVMLFDTSQDGRSESAELNARRITSSLLPTAEEQRSFDFDDPSPITERTASLHLIRYGGYATILDTGARELRNRFSNEQVVTLGQLRRYEVMLDLHDRRVDGSVPDAVPRGVAVAVMNDLHR